MEKLVKNRIVTVVEQLITCDVERGGDLGWILGEEFTQFLIDGVLECTIDSDGYEVELDYENEQVYAELSTDMPYEDAESFIHEAVMCSNIPYQNV